MRKQVSRNSREPKLSLKKPYSSTQQVKPTLGKENLSTNLMQRFQYHQLHHAPQQR